MEVKTRITKIVRPYAEDYAGWVEDTAAAIAEGRFDEIDRVALADEVRDLGITEQTRVSSAMGVLLMHLLNTKYQPEKRTRRWPRRSGCSESTIFPEVCGWTVAEVLGDLAGG